MSHHISTKTVKTRKEHYCFGCQRDFPAGTEMSRTTCVDMGRIFSTYECDVCQEVVMGWDDSDRYDGYCEGDVRYGCEETWEACRKEIEEPTDET